MRPPATPSTAARRCSPWPESPVPEVGREGARPRGGRGPRPGLVHFITGESPGDAPIEASAARTRSSATSRAWSRRSAGRHRPAPGDGVRHRPWRACRAGRGRPRPKLACKSAALSFAQAAAVPGVTQTALAAVRDRVTCRPGSGCSFLGASGGVGTYAVQLAGPQRLHVTRWCSAAKARCRASAPMRVLDYATHRSHRRLGALRPRPGHRRQTGSPGLRRALTLPAMS